MTYYPDMSPCAYFELDGEHNLLAVGWLGEHQPFRMGSVPEAFYLRLKELLRDPWQPVIFMGIYKCPFCQFDGARGTANLFVPFDGHILVAPELILHYVACHHYSPPGEFIEAVEECPDIRSMDYKRKLLKNGGGGLLKLAKRGDTNQTA